MSIPAIRVINLDRSVERLQSFASCNAHLGDITRVAGVDGAYLDRKELVRSGYIAESLSYPPGSLGCAMSHIRLWETVVAENRSLTILEDDTLVSHHFYRRASEVLASAPADWDIIQWGQLLNPLFAWVDLGISKVKLAGYGERRYQDESGKAEFQREDRPSTPIKLLHAFGLQGYSISVKGARAALNYCLPLRDRLIEFPEADVATQDLGIDVALCGLYPAVKAFVCFPPLVVHADDWQSERLAIDQLPWSSVSPFHQEGLAVSRHLEPPQAIDSTAQSIVVFVHPGISHILHRLVGMLTQGLIESGLSPVLLDTLPPTYRHPILVIGANLLDRSERDRLPSHAMILNVENSASPFMTEDYIQFLARMTVWDYDKANAAHLAQLFGRPVFYFKMFYVDSLSRGLSAPETDIDVLFFGSFNARRSQILDGLRARGLAVAAIYDVFSDALDALVARAKVVVNIHFYDNGRLEMIRLFDLLANGRAVVSELNAGETVDADLAGAFVGVPYDQLIDATEAFVHDPQRRGLVAEEGFRAFSRRKSGDVLPEALAWSAEQHRSSTPSCPERHLEETI